MHRQWMSIKILGKICYHMEVARVTLAEHITLGWVDFLRAMACALWTEHSGRAKSRLQREMPKSIRCCDTSFRAQV